MNKQISMSFVQDELADVKTNKTAFLEQMNRIVPWGNSSDTGRRDTEAL